MMHLCSREGPPGENMPDSAPSDLSDHFFSISRLLAGKLDFHSAIRAVATEVAQILPHDHLDVCILRAEGNFHTAYESGFQTVWGTHPAAPVTDSPIRPLLLGEVDHILTADACNDPRFRRDAPWHRPIFEHGLKSRIHVPMMVHGEIIGAFSCSRLAPAVYGPEDVRIARFVADLLSPYFYALRSAEQAHKAAIVEAEARAREEGLRLGALRLTEALETERQRIGMDLHDQTLADLTRLVRRLESIARSERASSEVLDPVARGLHQCMQDLRQIIDQAKPSVLHLFGFAQAVENHLERSVRDSGLSIGWTFRDDSAGAFDRLDPKVSVALFRIAQEAVNNAVHHAGASAITLRLSASGRYMTMDIVDDGTGIPRGRGRTGSGIDNMRTRARLISARFALGAGPGGRGTQVSIHLAQQDVSTMPVTGAIAP